MFLDPDQIALWGSPAPWQPIICLSDRWDLCVVLDEEDYLWARQWKWGHTIGSGGKIAYKCKITGATKRGVNTDKVYAKRSVGRAGTVFLHREITKRAYGPPPSGAHISDHKNGDSLDCRRENLRWATLSQNARNLYGSALLQRRLL